MRSDYFGTFQEKEEVSSALLLATMWTEVMEVFGKGAVGAE